MALELYAHPFSSYCQKVLIALHANAREFVFRLLGDDPDVAAEHARLWPLKRMPLLVDGSQTVFESSCIIEYLDLRYPGPRPMLPAVADDALQARMLDRYFDHYVMTPMQKIVFDCIRTPPQRDPHGVADARSLLDSSYAWLEAHFADGRPWATGERYTLADCAAAPSLFYADWVHPISAAHCALRDYRARLLADPVFAQIVDAARPWRHWFPPGAPDRD